MKAIKVLHVCQNATPRVFKEIIAQQNSNSRIRPALLYAGTWHKELLAMVFNQATWTSAENLRNHIHRFKIPFDVIHVHTTLANGSGKLLDLVREAVGANARIVHDIHDFTGDVSQHADHAIVTGPGMEDQVKSCPSTIVYSMVPEMLFPPVLPTKPLINSGVLCSGVGIPGRDPVWRDYTEAQETFPDLFIIPTDYNLELAFYYSNLLHPVQFPATMDQIAKFAWAFCAAANSEHNIDSCVTNKFWEAIAAGLPVFLRGARDMENIAQEIGWPNVNEPLEFNRTELHSKRYAFTMESQLPAMLSAYTK